MRVYLSHTDDLEQFAATLAADLQRQGLTPIRRSEVPVHTRVAAGRALKAADALVFVIGRERGADVERDWSNAVEESWAHPGKPFIPVVLSSAVVPAFLQDRQAIRIQDPETDREHVSQTLMSALRGEAPAGRRVEGARERIQKARLDTLEQYTSALEPRREELLREAAALQKTLAHHHARASSAEIATTATALADVMTRLKQPEDALRYQQTALAALGAAGGADAAGIARLHTNVASTLQTLGRHEEAVGHLEQAADIFRRTRGPDTMQVAMTEASLAALLDRLGRTDEANAHRRLAGKAFKNAFVAVVRGLPIVGPFFARVADSDARKAGGAPQTDTTPPAKARQGAAARRSRKAAGGRRKASKPIGTPARSPEADRERWPAVKAAATKRKRTKSASSAAKTARRRG